MFRVTANSRADVDVHVEVKQARKGHGNRIQIQIKRCRLSFINSSPVYVNHHCSLNREQHEGANSFDQHPDSLCFSLDYVHK